MAEVDQSLEEINKTLVPLMDGIQKSKLSISKSQKEENIEISKTFLEVLITKMKEKDTLFKVLYQKNYYTGSYYEGLRVAEASEFDVNLILKFPFKPEDREMYTLVHIKPCLEHDSHSGLDKWVVVESYTSLNSWMGHFMLPPVAQRYVCGLARYNPDFDTRGFKEIGIQPTSWVRSKVPIRGQEMLCKQKAKEEDEQMTS